MTSEPGRRSDAGPGRQVGRFILRRELGRGGMGIVYLARDPTLGRDVAIKMLLDPARSDQGELERFAREAQASARLDHPGIVGVHEVGAHDGRPYLVMRYVEGESLEAAARDHLLEPRRAAELIQQVADALDCAHAAGVLHRDVKPSNVLIDGEGSARLMDFGLARDTSARTQLTATGQILGTPSFMAPEQADGDLAHGPFTDVYGLGALLYWALVGRPPFEGDTPFEIIKRVLFDEPVAPRRLESTVPLDLETIALKCLEKEPGRRYASAGAVADELERFLEGRPILARPLGPIGRIGRWAGGHRLFAVALVLTLVAGGVGVSGLVRSRLDQAKRERVVADAARRAADAAGALARARTELAGSSTPDHAKLLALALEAMQAARVHHALAPRDQTARGAVSDASMTLGYLAIEAEQWGLAEDAFEAAIELGVEDEVAREALAGVAEARDRGPQERMAAVEAVLELVRRGEILPGSEGLESAIAELVRYDDPATVERLAEELGRITELLLDVVRSLQSSRDARRSAAVAQASALGEADEAMIEVCCGALGRMGDAGRSVDALGGYLAAEMVQTRAAVAGLALCRIGGVRAERHLLATRDRLGAGGLFWRRVAPRLEPTKLDVELEDPTPARFRDRGELRRQIGDLEGALADFDRALELDPDDPESRTSRGSTLLALKDLDGALAEFDRALELDPSSIQAVGGRGTALLRRGDFEGALDALDEALALDPRRFECWVNRGVIRARLGELEGARLDFVRAVQLEPLDPRGWTGLAWVASDRGDHRSALVLADKAIEVGPRESAGWVGRARALRSQGKYAEAIADAGRAIDLDPLDEWAWQERAYARHVSKDLQGAIADYDRTIELVPTAVFAWLQRGRARFGLVDSRGRYLDADGAIADVGRAIELDPDDGNKWANRGRMRFRTGDLEGSVSDHDRAIALDSKDVTSLYYRSRARRRLGDRAGAIEDLKRAVALAPPSKFADRLRADLEALTAGGSE